MNASERQQPERVYDAARWANVEFPLLANRAAPMQKKVSPKI